VVEPSFYYIEQSNSDSEWIRNSFLSLVADLSRYPRLYGVFDVGCKF